MSEIKLGEKYKLIDDGEVKQVIILYIGNDSLFYLDTESKEEEGCYIRFFGKNATKIEPEREKIELFLCVTRTFMCTWMDKEFRSPMILSKTWCFPSKSAQRVSPSQSMFIYADTFEVVGE